MPEEDDEQDETIQDNLEDDCAKPADVLRIPTENLPE